jgi:hypothetical protein
MDFTAAERATFTLVDRDPVITEASGSSGRAAFGEKNSWLLLLKHRYPTATARNRPGGGIADASVPG